MHKQPEPTNQRDSKGRRLWKKWCPACGKETLTRYEGVRRQCRSCVKLEEGGFPEGTLLDPEFAHYAKWKWRVINSGYVYHTVFGLLHRLVMKDKLAPGLEVDHLNKNKLDNRRENLQVVTPTENSRRKRESNWKTSDQINFF